MWVNGCFKNNKKGAKEKFINAGNVSGKSLIMKIQKTNGAQESGEKKRIKIFSLKQNTKMYSLAEMLGRLAFCGFEILNFSPCN